MHNYGICGLNGNATEREQAEEEERNKESKRKRDTQ